MRAFLDTTPLFGQNLRNFILWIAYVGGYVPLWSSEVLRELDDALAELGVLATRRHHLLSELRRAFPEALVPVPEARHGFGIEDPGDVHVIDAAVAAGADVLVSDDVSHFTSEVMTRAGIVRVGTQAFALERLENLSATQVRALEVGFGPPEKLNSFPRLKAAYAARADTVR